VHQPPRQKHADRTAPPPGPQVPRQARSIPLTCGDTPTTGLRPSLLQVYVRNPDVPTGAIRLRRLAAVSGSTRTALAFALTGLTPASRRHLPPPSPAESQADRKARLFGTIRDDAARGRLTRRSPPWPVMIHPDVDRVPEDP
jgi:hypothetical protein